MTHVNALPPFDPHEREAERLAMVRDQIEGRGIGYYKILHAMRAIPRHLFVPSELQDQAYTDTALPLAEQATISQPYVMAMMVSLLRPEKGQRVLEIGTGSGYQAALLAHMGAQVFSMDIQEPLVRKAVAPLTRLNLMDTIKLRVGDGYEGWLEAGPFDGILLSCSVRTIPELLIRQLKVGGKLVAPLGPAGQTQTLTLAVKKPDHSLSYDSLSSVVFVPLAGPHAEDESRPPE